MKGTFGSKLYHREIGTGSNSYHKLYTDRSLINDLDIVNELDGHSGCVNALSWSKSGNLLASGILSLTTTGQAPATPRSKRAAEHESGRAL